MITYLYWATAAVIALFLLILLVKNGAIKAGMLAFSIVIIGAWAAYYFHFEQIFVKNFGGVMTIDMKEGEYHLGLTWKEDNLWIESYDPETQSCHFREFSKGNLLQGRVNVRNCRPLLLQNTPTASSQTSTVKPQQTVAAVSEQESASGTANDADNTPDKPITLDDMPDIQ